MVYGAYMVVEYFIHTLAVPVLVVCIFTELNVRFACKVVVASFVVRCLSNNKTCARNKKRKEKINLCQPTSHPVFARGLLRAII